MRYLKATIVCALIASATALALFECGAFERLDAKLAAFLGHHSAPETGRASQYLPVLLLAAGIAWTTLVVARPELKALLAGIALMEALASAWVVDALGGFFSPFATALAVVLAFALAFACSRTPAGRRAETLHHLLDGRVSPGTIGTLLKSHRPPHLDGEVRLATVLVCEVMNHEQLRGSLRVQDYVEMVNTFLRSASGLLIEHGAYLDECNGESVRAVFGAPLADEKHALHACETALALATRLESVNQECKNVWGHRLDFRIGVNSGEMVMAAYGSERLGSFSVAGEPAEFARRLCAANTIYGSRILIGDRAFTLAESGIEVRPMELIQRDPQNPSREEVYELVGTRGSFAAEDREKRDVFWKGIVFFRENKLDEALACFRLAVELGGGDEPAEFYIRRIEQLRAGLPSLGWVPAKS